MLVHSPIRSTRFDAKTVAVPHGIKARPRWTITISEKDWTNTWMNYPRYHSMQVWLTENMQGYRVHLTPSNLLIEAITFRKHSDAMLFYLRFR